MYENLLQSTRANTTRPVLESNNDKIREIDKYDGQVIKLVSQLSADSNANKLFYTSSGWIVSD